MDLSSLVIIVLGGVAALIACWGLTARERAYAIVAFVLHILASFGQLWVHRVYYTDGSDATGYLRAGEAIAKLLDYNFWGFAPEVVKLFFHFDTSFAFVLYGEGGSTGTAAAVAGAFAYVSSPSLIDLFLITTWISWFGQLCWYRIAREELPSSEHTLALLGCMYVPSAIFWGAAFAKEALVMGGFGVLGLSTYRLLRHRRLAYLLGIIFGVLVVAMLKAYTLVPFVLAVSTFLFVSRARSSHDAVKLRPAYTMLAVVVAVAGVAAMGSAFPEYSAENISHTLTSQQQSWDESLGGSTIARVGGDADGIGQQLAYIPVALINSFFRPTLFEANGGPAVGAALETTLLAIAVLALLNGKGAVLRTLTSSPFLAASAVFIFVFAVAVGLTTSNLGSLSRYRVPMLPFCTVVLLIIHRRKRLAVVSARRAPVGIVRPRRPTERAT